MTFADRDATWLVDRSGRRTRRSGPGLVEVQQAPQHLVGQVRRPVVCRGHGLVQDGMQAVHPGTDRDTARVVEGREGALAQDGRCGLILRQQAVRVARPNLGRPHHQRRRVQPTVAGLYQGAGSPGNRLGTRVGDGRPLRRQGIRKRERLEGGGWRVAGPVFQAVPSRNAQTSWNRLCRMPKLVSSSRATTINWLSGRNAVPSRRTGGAWQPAGGSIKIVPLHTGGRDRRRARAGRGACRGRRPQPRHGGYGRGGRRPSP